MAAIKPIKGSAKNSIFPQKRSDMLILFFVRARGLDLPFSAESITQLTRSHTHMQMLTQTVCD